MEFRLRDTTAKKLGLQLDALFAALTLPGCGLQSSLHHPCHSMPQWMAVPSQSASSQMWFMKKSRPPFYAYIHNHTTHTHTQRHTHTHVYILYIYIYITVIYIHTYLVLLYLLTMQHIHGMFFGLTQGLPQDGSLSLMQGTTHLGCARWIPRDAILGRGAQILMSI